MVNWLDFCERRLLWGHDKSLINSQYIGDDAQATGGLAGLPGGSWTPFGIQKAAASGQLGSDFYCSAGVIWIL